MILPVFSKQNGFFFLFSDASSAPVQCSKGRYSRGGSTSCTLCVAGTIALSTKDGCQPCAPGYACANSMNDPTPCANGTWSIGGEVTSCSVCAPGFRCPFKDARPIPCPRGKILPCPASIIMVLSTALIFSISLTGRYSGSGETTCTGELFPGSNVDQSSHEIPNLLSLYYVRMSRRI